MLDFFLSLFSYKSNRMKLNEEKIRNKSSTYQEVLFPFDQPVSKLLVAMVFALVLISLAGVLLSSKPTIRNSFEKISQSFLDILRHDVP